MNNKLTLPLLLVVAGCAGAAEVAETPQLPPPPAPPQVQLPGVDSVFVAIAEAYSASWGVDNNRQEAARRAVAGGRQLMAAYDSLILQFALPTETGAVDEALAVERFNAGAQLLQADSPGINELREAASLFRQALGADPSDTEARYWLSVVYERLYEHLGSEGDILQAVEVLEQLVELHPHRHDYTGLLAGAKDKAGDARTAGALWHRASVLVVDDALLSPDADATIDSARAFAYLANAGRSFADADEADMALAALEEAGQWAQTPAEREYLSREREWLTWDERLSTRKEFDRMLTMAGDDPAAAVPGLRSLAGQVTRRQAQQGVQHQLALTLHAAGDEHEALEVIQRLWADLAETGAGLLERVREDYGVMAYGAGLKRREQGDMRSAAAYLLQSESTGFSQAPVVALTLSLMLRNNHQQSLEAAKRAESGWDALDDAERRTLLQHMVDLLRRLGEREQAQAYVDRLRAM